MLRWIVVAILLANIFVFGWYRYAIGDGGVPSLSLDVPAGDALQLLAGDFRLGSQRQAEGGDAALKKVQDLGRIVPTSGAATCGMIGAFSEQISARQVRDRLRALGAAADVVELPVPVRTDYWVHLGPYMSRELAMDSLRELQQKGVDSFLIAEGELANGVSLGLFRQKASAEALLAERRGQGYDAALREVPRIASEIWVAIKEGGELAEPVLKQLLTVSPGTEYRKNLCSLIVTASKFE